MSAGIYIHIPFCKSKCHYCDFYSVIGDSAGRIRFLNGLIEEIKIRADSPMAEQVCDSIYFGGGTPSILGAQAIGKIIDEINRRFRIASDSEITIEANPEAVTENFFDNIRQSGANRLSIGIQSFEDEELRLLGRIHDSRMARNAITAALKSGLDNISIDLIFGIPGQTLVSWERSLGAAVNYRPAHISAYGLTIEKGTPLERLVISGKIKLPDESIQTTMYEMLVDVLMKSGYQRYEISNFALAGRESRHNLKYWLGEAYLGLGASAHSFDGLNRSANARDLGEYLSKIKSGLLPIAFTETLTGSQKVREKMLLGLRLARGVVAAKNDSAISANMLQRLMDSGHVIIEDEQIRLTDSGFLVADEVIARLVN